MRDLGIKDSHGYAKAPYCFGFNPSSTAYARILNAKCDTDSTKWVDCTSPASSKVHWECDGTYTVDNLATDMANGCGWNDATHGHQLFVGGWNLLAEQPLQLADLRLKMLHVGLGHHALLGVEAL